MGLLARSFYKLQFALGIYELRQITKIERSSIVVNTMRYELTPDRWVLFAYRFFPRQCNQEIYNKYFIENEICYDYYDNRGDINHSRSYRNKAFYYSLFKNGEMTAYIIEGHYSDYGRSFGVISISNSEAGEYRRSKGDHKDKPIYHVMSEQEAAICMLDDAYDFEPLKVDLESLVDEAKYAEFPSSMILYELINKVLPRCRFSEYFLK